MVELENSIEKKFYSKFRKNYLPSYDFFRLFFAKLSLQGITLIESNKLKEFLLNKKTNIEYSELLQDINFYFNGFSYISKDIEKNINTLQTLGALGRSNPSYEILLNYFSNESSKKVINELNSYEVQINKLIEDFQQYV